MNRLSVRLFASHLLVAAVGALTFALLVRLLAPPMFEHDMGRMGIGMMGQGGALNDAFASAVDNALLVGVLVSLLAAAAAGAFAAYRTLRPLEDVRAATRRLAAGHYDETVPVPAEAELAALADDVNALGAALAATESRRTRLLGEVAHEMRTPLTVIDGYVEGLIDGVFPADADVLGDLSVEVGRLRRLADDLSQLSRAEEHRLDLRLQHVDLGALADEVAERLRPQADDAGLTLTARAEAAVPVVGDPDRLAQAITNLVGNALAATPAGGSVSVRCGAGGGVATATVTDTGVGLEGDDVTRVFERFYRVPGAGRRHGAGGSGIGLTIAREIVRAHGGDLTASSAGLGRGATFTVTLPVTDAVPASAADAVRSGRGPAAGR